LIGALRLRLELVELFRPAREWRRSGRAQPRRAVAMYQLGALMILVAPVTKGGDLFGDPGPAELRWQHGFGKRRERRRIAFETCDGRRMGATSDSGQRNGRGERREEGTPGDWWHAPA